MIRHSHSARNCLTLKPFRQLLPIVAFALLITDVIGESTSPAWAQVAPTEYYNYPDPPGSTNLLWIEVEGANGKNGNNQSGDCLNEPGSSSAGDNAPNLNFSISGANSNSYAGGMSSGGVGGNGGDGVCDDGRGGSSGGNAGTVSVNLSDNAQIVNSINALFDLDGDPYIFGLIGSALAGNGGNGGKSDDGTPGNGGSGGMTESSADTGYGAGTVEITIDATSTISTSSALFSIGVIGQSAGGQGGNAGGGGTAPWAKNASGGNGGFSGPVSILNEGSIELTLTGGLDAQGAALLAQSVGGQGGNAGSGGFSFVTFGNTGGSGGPSDVVSIQHRGLITATGTNAIGINAQSVGGGGGSVPNSTSLISVGGSSGGAGGNANNSSVEIDGGRVHTYGDYGIGVLVQSIGGGGGSVGGQTGLNTVGSTGGFGGDGEEAQVSLQNGAVITTGLRLDGQSDTQDGQGVHSPAVIAQSIGGGGGNAGTNTGEITIASSGGDGGDGGTVQAELGAATLATQRLFSPGLLLQSIGGGGGNGGSTKSASESSTISVAVASGGDGAPGGNGGQVQISALGGTTQIITRGGFSSGMVLQSIGGSGGSGGSAFSASGGGTYSSSVAVGGNGGTGGNAESILIGDSAAPVSANISTTGVFSPGITLQAVGGGGGSGGDSNAYSAGGVASGSVAVGGSGGKGGDGGPITSYLSSEIQTTGFQSPALSLASIGGGGGSGGSSHSGSLSGGFSGSLAIGGTAGDGGSGQTISSTFTGSLLTSGDFSPGLSFTNIGGGGGDGGMSLSLSAAGVVSAAPSVGGTGGGGGNAGSSELSFTGTSATTGRFAPAFSARSIGGGGGNGGLSLSASAASTVSVGTAVGGSGATGGDGGDITATINTGSVLKTSNLQSPGLHLQSIGGGGGNGGAAVSGSVAISPYPNLSASVAVGGSAANGGDGGDVSLAFEGDVFTGREGVQSDDISTPFSSGILLQSIGGGGGTGGVSVAPGASISDSDSFNGDVAIGGSAGDGGSGGIVDVTSLRFSRIDTKGRFSPGIQLQSIGGGGGNGGNSASLTLTGSSESSWSGSVAIGGTGGSGGDGGDLSLIGAGELISTGRAFSPGAFLQSIGGGGGSGGNATSLLATGGSSALTGGVDLGGRSGSGGDGGDVSLQLAASVQTSQQHSPSIAAQSIGGGGGKGGTSFSGSITGSTSNSFDGTATVGGNGSAGGSGGTISLITTGSRLSSNGSFAPNILGQSIGGGGGHGGNSTNLQATFSGSTAYSLTPTIGGQAGSGGDAGTITVSNEASLMTGRDSAIRSAHFSPGILAQSIGGGGGNGGSDLSGSLTLNLSDSGSSTSTANLGSAIGGNGGGGGNGGTVTITNANSGASTTTTGHFSPGISGQSIGGGGGNGGSSQSGSLTLTVASQISSDVVIGGNGAQAGTGGSVMITNAQSIYSGNSGGDDPRDLIRGHFSPGILAQSVGGGGGSGGSSLSSTFSVANVNSSSSATSSSMALTGTATVGGRGGSGGDGGAVTVVNEADALTTRGSFSAGIQAQSIGGGGGSGGNATTKTGALGTASSTGTVAVGGNAEGGGDGSAVSLRNQSAISTGWDRSDGHRGNFSPGLIAQSIGGGGGIGGNSSTDEVTHNTSRTSGKQSGSFYSLGVSLGGKGGSGGSGGNVLVQTSHPVISTNGDFSSGVVAQSIGGGGGKAGNSNLINRTKSVGATAITGGLALGGVGGAGGKGGDVVVELEAPDGSNNPSGAIVTRGAFAYGLLAHSIGGGGGAGGNSLSTNESTSKSGSPSDANRSGAIQLGGLGGQNWGNGGQGGSAGSVAIVGDALIQTSGDGATALLAQSIGGGGGAGGDVTSTVKSSSKKSSRNEGFVSMTVGGEGGAGQHGGNVSWQSSSGLSSSLSTGGAQSHGALLQSIGGGGGSGGSSTQNANINAPSTYSFGGFGSSGGSGANAANGGVIQIGAPLSPLTGSINTVGIGAAGLVAQSIGGGGGAGGGSTTDTSSTSTYGVSLGFGGAGGDGGSGGALSTLARLDVLTQGIQAPAVVLQSIGGGGGLGGNTSTSSATTLPKDSKAKTSLSFGGSAGGEAGSGGDGGVITADLSGQLVTTRSGSDALVVQSIGGGGGHGGNSTISNSLKQSSGSGSLPVVLSFGGGGGRGGKGGTIIFDSAEGLALDTTGHNSQGLSLQSIGGGGGRGGNVSSFGSNSSKTDINLGAAVAIGASGGGGGDGGAVSIGQQHRATSLLIQTRGRQAPGLLVQSIGGGGGSGSNTSSGTSAGSITGSFGLGGSGGSGGKGNSVQVIADLNLNTTGASSAGALLQSIGGGGGQAGHVRSDVSADASEIKSSFSLGLSAAEGGNGGGGGGAGAVDATLSGKISTAADLSAALSLQSIGGGGGDAGEVVSGASAKGGKTSASLGFALGGKGGDGGNGAAVSLSQPINNGLVVQTQGDLSHGIHLQSIGGGGGRASSVHSLSSASGDGSLGITLSIGAQAGNGGSGGSIDAMNAGSVRTAGIDAHALVAQSIGGGGGQSSAVRSGLTRGTTTINGVIGGRGGEGGHAGSINLDNQSRVVTSGDNSMGLMLQSIGGGGGMTSVNVRNPGSEDSLNGQLRIGGQSGKGGNGNTITAINGGQILTSGQIAHAVMLQSIGGGGGHSTIQAGPSASASDFSLNLGGTGGDGGHGGNLVVDNTGQLLTSGAGSQGVIALSIGGGGGSVSSRGPVNAVLGSSSGGGGNGGTIEINNDSGAEIRTSGDVAMGVIALSIGGGGGFVGDTSSDVNVGSTGGNGGDGGDILIRNSGSIETSGTLAIPVVALSVGGGGGLMASASGQIRLGADGASGDGGDVELNNNNGVINSTGAFSPAFLLQSLGGGGGHLGSASLQGTGAAAAGTSPVLLGGGHLQGSSGSGGRLTLLNQTGEINTTGIFSPGIIHQSIGGGGGWIGSVSDGNLRLGGRSHSRSEGAAIDLVIPLAVRTIGPNSSGVLVQSIGGGGGAAEQVMGAARLGGEADAGSAVRGGPLRVTQQMPIRTTGSDSPALLLQSIGAGGGRVSAVRDSTELGATINPGVNASAGSIRSTINASISTAGERSPGVVLQSIGGGGGYAKGSESTSLGASSGEAGSDASRVDSGAITLTNNAKLSTSGQQSLGLLVQSIAGGGGISGSSSGRIDQSSAGLDGESGAIQIVNNGSITTTGDGAHAVVAQSISGGGGFVLGSSNDSSTVNRVASPRGRSGTISINNNGLIQTQGKNSIAVLAQSAINGAVISQNKLSGPQRNASRLTTPSEVRADHSIGSVVIRNSGMIRATGQGGIGITKSTNTNAEDANLRVVNDSGALIEGGPGGTAIQLPTPEKESVLNNGLIIGGPIGLNLAIEGIGGNDEIINNGTLAGNIQIRGTTNKIINDPGSRIESDSISLGLRSDFINRGILSPSGFHRIGSLEITAKYIQTETGIYEFDLDVNDNRTDQLIINNPSVLNGSMVMKPIKTGLAKPGEFISDDFISAPRLREGNLSFVAHDTAVANYEMVKGSNPDNSLAVAYQIDFSPGGLNPNSRNVGNAFNTIQLEGPNSEQQRLTAAYVYQIPTVQELNNTYRQLSGEQLTAFPQSIIQFTNAQQEANQDAIDALPTGLDMSCPNPEEETPDTSCQRWTAWFQGDGFSMNATGQGSSNQSSWSSQAYDLSLGIGYAAGERTTAGLIAQQATLWSNTSGLDAQGTSELWNGSVFVKQRLGPSTVLSLQMGGGSATSDIEREVKLPLSTTEESSQAGTTWKGVLQLGHGFEINKDKDAWITPKLSVGWINYNQPGFSETTKSSSSSWARPTGRFNRDIDPEPTHSLSVEDVSVTSVPIKLQLDYQQDIALGNTTITPRLSVGYTTDAGNRSRQQTATFSNEPNAPFLVKGSDAPQSWWDLNAAVNIDLSKSFSLYLNVEADIAPAIANTMRYGGGFLFRF